ncbi:MAG: hypothetical protein R6X34_06740 [Chloroflexota bacterium]
MTEQLSNGQPAQSRTLQLKGVNSRFLLSLLFFLLLYLLAAEAVVRWGTGRLPMGAPSLGGEHTQFEQQWFRLQEYAVQRGGVECLFLGDSTVMTDFAPGPFTEAYRQETGEVVDCFNFGVGAVTAVGFAALSELLVQEYRPRLLLVGVQALSFTVPEAEQGSADLAANAWVRYKLGNFNLEGWLYEHSYLYRHLGALGQLATFNVNPQEVMQSATGEVGGVQDGFYPMVGPGPFDVAEVPDLAVDHPYLEHYFAVMGGFQMLPENLAALERIMALDSPATQVIVVEMPVPETFYAFFANGSRDYEAFVAEVAGETAVNHIPFWRITDPSQLPASLWFNYNHLTADGAPIFSRWLGETMAKWMENRD